MKYQEWPYRSAFEIRAEEPSIKDFRDVIFVPREGDTNAAKDPRWGLYAADGALIEEASYRRGFARKIVGQSLNTSFEGQDIEEAPPGKYLYGGLLAIHFGHFLMGTIARLWPALKQDLSDFKIVCHGLQTPDLWFAESFIRDIFNAVGLKEENFLTFDRPTRISHITVPETACEEEHFGCAVYAEWGHKIGGALLRDSIKAESGTPVFLAKTEVRNLVHGAINEDEFVAVLAGEGVDIVHPEKMSITEQVMMWRDRKFILGSAGSALHSSILWPPGARIAACSVRSKVHSNCGIIDKVNANNISYTFPAVEALGKYTTDTHQFLDGYRLKRPKAAAHNLLKAAGI